MSFGEYELLGGGGPGLQFPFPFLDVLTIPTDAADNEPRVVINGPDGEIQIYGSGGDLVGLLTPTGPNDDPGFFMFEPGDPTNYVALETIAGFPGITFVDSEAGIIGRWSEGRTGSAGTTQQFNYAIRTPGPTGQSRAEISMVSESDDGTLAPVIDLTATGSATTDARINGESVPRGIWDQFSSEANDAGNPYSGDSVTDMVITNVGSAKGGVFAGRTYAIHVSFLLQFSAAPGQWNIFLRVNGSNIGRIYRADATDDGLNVNIERTLYWTPSVDSTTDDLDVFLDEVSGAVTASLLGSADNLLRTLTVVDMGVL